jgi:hypothetical protein
MIPRPHFEAEAEILSLAARGWRLFPCVPHTKTPLLKSWPNLASCDPATIRKWAVKYPSCNWAVACGAESGIWVLDVDGENGRLSLALLEKQCGRLPATLTSRTGRKDGGEHRFFAWPADHNIRNSTGKVAAGLDIRGSGGYVIVPPSIHWTGQTYRWADSDLTIAAAPLCLLERVTAAQRFIPTPTAEIGILFTGQRNDGLTRLGGAFRRKGSQKAEIESELLVANARRCSPPLSEVEVFKIAASVARYEPGSPDPLETAWKMTEGGAYLSRYERFLALAHHLQQTRPGMAIALPLQRIGALMGIHWTSVSLYRQKAVANALLEPVGDYIPHRRAGLYRVLEKTETLTKTLTSGLVRVGENSPSEIPLVRVNRISPSESENFHSENKRRSTETSWNIVAREQRAPRCYVHGTETRWWERIDGDLVCGRCHPNPAEGAGAVTTRRSNVTRQSA